MCEALLREDARPAKLLQAAAAAGNLQLCSLLLEHGAKPSILQSEALACAAGSDSAQVVVVVELLLKHGAQASAQESEALMCAAAGGHTAVVQKLLALGQHGVYGKNQARAAASANGDSVPPAAA